MGGAMSEITIRATKPGEAAIITRNLRAMFAEIRQLPAEQLDAMAAFEPWAAARLARDEYRGWFAANAAGQVVVGAGLWLMDWPPPMTHVQPRRGNI